MPHFNPDESRVSASVRRLNPDLFRVGQVGSVIHREPPRALVQGPQPKPRRRTRLGYGADLTIAITACLWRRMDPDNLGHALKPLQDAIAAWLELDDGDPRIRWEYGQVETRGTQGVSVKIECGPS